MRVKVAEGLFIRDSQEADIETVASTMREEDAREVIAAGEGSPLAALRGSFDKSCVRLTVELDGIPVAMFGLAPASWYSQSAVVWFLGADAMARVPKAFVKASRIVISWFLDKYPEGIYNTVDARYTKTVRWLKSCGAEFGPPQPGPTGIPFEFFVIRRRK